MTDLIKRGGSIYESDLTVCSLQWALWLSKICFCFVFLSVRFIKTLKKTLSFILSSDLIDQVSIICLGLLINIEISSSFQTHIRLCMTEKEKQLCLWDKKHWPWRLPYTCPGFVYFCAHWPFGPGTGSWWRARWNCQPGIPLWCCLLTPPCSPPPASVEDTQHMLTPFYVSLLQYCFLLYHSLGMLQARVRHSIAAEAVLKHLVSLFLVTVDFTWF